MKYYEILPQKGFYLLAGLFILWGILGKMDSSNYTYRGFQTGDNNQIINLDEDGPAASAGFELGDVVITNGGIDQNDIKLCQSVLDPILVTRESMLLIEMVNLFH